MSHHARRDVPRKLEVGVDLRIEGRPRDAGSRERLTRAGRGDFQARAAGQRLVDQAVELRIVERFHQSRRGQGATADVAASERAAANVAALCGSACVDSPAVLAQALSSNDAQTRTALRAT